MSETRARRAFVFFLIVVTLVVLVRAVASARGAMTGTGEQEAAGFSFRIQEPGGLLAAGETANRTLLIAGSAPRSGEMHIEWVAQVEGVEVANGQSTLSSPGKSGVARVPLAIPAPPLGAPAGLDLLVRASIAGVAAGASSFPFVLYPSDEAHLLRERLARARVALFDPEKKAASVLRALGVDAEEFSSIEGLRLYAGDLIVVGPGGFARGQEALGPILAARARMGMPILLLDQPTLPATLTEGLRLWPSFNRSSRANVLFAADHPVLRGLPPERGRSYFASMATEGRPLLPPTRGNFRVLAEVRAGSGSSYQEGVAILEFPIGRGTLLAAQASLCAEYATDARARIILVNALNYLLGQRPAMKRTFAYGRGAEALPLCLTHLSVPTTPPPSDLEGVDLLIVPGDWGAPRRLAGSTLPPLARAARFLHDGGTMLLLSPQSIVLDYLRGVVGAPVYFEENGGGTTGAQVDALSLRLMQGVAPEDLDLLKETGRPEFRLRVRQSEDPIVPILLAPGLVRYRVGRGDLVALTLPDADACRSPRISSLLARLLTNLGVPLDSGPGLESETISLLGE